MAIRADSRLGRYISALGYRHVTDPRLTIHGGLRGHIQRFVSSRWMGTLPIYYEQHQARPQWRRGIDRDSPAGRYVGALAAPDTTPHTGSRSRVRIRFLASGFSRREIREIRRLAAHIQDPDVSVGPTVLLGSERLVINVPGSNDSTDADVTSQHSPGAEDAIMNPQADQAAPDDALPPIPVLLIALRHGSRALVLMLDEVRAVASVVDRKPIPMGSRETDRALALTRDLQRCLDGAFALGSVIALDRSLDRALDRVALTLDAQRRVNHVHATALAKASALADSIARALVDATTFLGAVDFLLVRAVSDDFIVALERADGIARSLVSELARIPADVSGSDLTSIDISDPELLAGVIWTDETRWPSGLASWVHEHSEEIGQGRYRIIGGTDREDADTLLV